MIITRSVLKTMSKFIKTQENDHVSIFLAGLNKELNEIRGSVLGPIIRIFFLQKLREEARQRVMMGRSNSTTDGSTLVTNNFNKDRKKYGKLWCDPCERCWHTRGTCWKLHGRPPNVKKKGEGRALLIKSHNLPQMHFHSPRNN